MRTVLSGVLISILVSMVYSEPFSNLRGKTSKVHEKRSGKMSEKVHCHPKKWNQVQFI